jgi:outer membrane lipoprotein-sorting protein
LKRISALCLSLCLLLAPGLPHAQGRQEACRILQALERKYAGLKDYTVAMRIHFDIETFRAPDLEARLYYKKPDRITIESKRVVFFPRDAGYFNPAQFRQEDYTCLPLGNVTYDKRKAVQIRLIPKKIIGQTQEMVLTIDPGELLVRQETVTQAGGKVITAEITYATFAGFELPAVIRLHLDLPAVEPGVAQGYGVIPNNAEEKRIQGTIAITYADYQVNTGLPDGLFEKNKP